MGKSTFNGLASFTTYDGAVNTSELDPKLLAINYEGLQLHREFYSPMYETKKQIESRLPDLRNTLLWSPDIITDTNGKASINFFSADVKGKYIVIVQGMSQHGDFVKAVTTFEVK